MSTRTLLLTLILGLPAPACGDSGSSSPDSGGGGSDAGGADAGGADASSVPAAFDPSQPYAPDIDPADLSADITHPLFPIPVGATWTYAAVTPDGNERTEISVEEATVDINGVAAREVRDTVYLDDELLEDTHDWFVQDSAGNVWYVGEDTAEYEAGEVVSTAGSWEWAVDGALPGVVMLAEPHVGDAYRQEYLVGEAEDYADIVSLDESVDVPAGTFTGCLKTRDRTTVEPDVVEFKYYCAGAGNVLTEEGDVRDELTAYTGL